ncbi:MAG: winged helix-turn-helix transcriptional regulator [Bacteroidota bacterium]
MNNVHKADTHILEILETVENNSEMTQRHLANRLGVALGLVNSYLCRCVRKGYIKIHKVPANRYLYYLTPKGFAEKSRLTAKYLASSLEFYRRAGNSCSEIFRTCQAQGWKRVVLSGSSDLAEIALIRAREFELEVLGIFDPGQSVDQLCGSVVWRRYEQLPEYDAMVLTVLRKPDLFLREIRKAVPDARRILIPSILGMSTDFLKHENS